MHQYTDSERQSIISSLADDMFAAHGGRYSPSDFAHALQQYSDDMLYRLLTGNHTQRARFHHVRQSVLNGCNEESLRERITFFPEYGAQQYEVVENVIKSLHCYQQLPATKDLTSAGPEVFSQSCALLAVMDAYRYCNLMEAFLVQDPPYVIADQRIVDLIVGSPEMAGEISLFIYDRNVSDADTLLSYFCSETPALRDGII